MSDLYSKLNRFNSFPLITTSVSSMLESIDVMNPNRIRAIIDNEQIISAETSNDNMFITVCNNISIKKYLNEKYGFTENYFNTNLTNKDVYIFTGNSFCGFLPTCHVHLMIPIPMGDTLTDEKIGAIYRDNFNVSNEIINALFNGNNSPLQRFCKINLAFGETTIKELYYNAHRYSLNLDTIQFDGLMDLNRRIANFLKYQLNLILTRYTGNPMDRISDYSKIHRWTVYAIHCLLDALEKNNLMTPELEGVKLMANIASPTFSTSENIPYEFKNIVRKELKIIELVEMAHDGKFKEFIREIHGNAFDEILDRVDINAI